MSKGIDFSISQGAPLFDEGYPTDYNTIERNKYTPKSDMSENKRKKSNKQKQKNEIKRSQSYNFSKKNDNDRFKPYIAPSIPKAEPEHSVHTASPIVPNHPKQQKERYSHQRQQNTMSKSKSFIQLGQKQQVKPPVQKKQDKKERSSFDDYIPPE